VIDKVEKKIRDRLKVLMGVKQTPYSRVESRSSFITEVDRLIYREWEASNGDQIYQYFLIVKKNWEDAKKRWETIQKSREQREM